MSCFVFLFPMFKVVYALKGMRGGPPACCFKASKQVRLVERKVSFISDADNWRGRWRVTDICPKADSALPPQPPPPSPQGEGENFYRQSIGEWLHAETAQSSLTVIFKLVITGLTTIILVVLGTVNL